MPNNHNTSRKLYLHVGPPKTGTSAIQYILSTYDGSNIVYPKVGLWKDGSHHNLIFSLMNDRTRPDAIHEEPAQLLQRLAAITSDATQSVLISSEAINPFQLPTLIEKIAPAVGLNQNSVEVVYVCRDHYARAASLYNQAVKDHVSRETRLPDEYLRHHAKGLCYADTLRQLDDLELTVKIIQFEPNDDFVSRFLMAVGVSDAGSFAEVRRNVSMSTKGLVALVILNALELDSSERATIFDRLRATPRFFLPQRQIFGLDTLRELEPIFSEDRCLLQERYGLELAEPKLDQIAGKLCITEAEQAEIAHALSSSPDVWTAMADRLQQFVRSAHD